MPDNGTCPNCGGALTYNANLLANECAYCGSSFKTKASDDKGEVSILDDAAFTPFTISKDQFKKNVLKWIVDQQDNPGDILSRSEFYGIEDTFVPVYLFKGKYTCQWTAFEENDNALRKLLKLAPKREAVKNGTLQNTFDVVALGNERYSTYNNKLWAIIQNSIDEADEIPRHPIWKALANLDIRARKMQPAIKEIVEEGIRTDMGLSVGKAWEKHGQQMVKAAIHKSLTDQHPGLLYTMDITYDLDPVSKAYLPFYTTKAVYHYEDGVGSTEYNICMDGATGDIFGETVQDAQVFSIKQMNLFPKFVGVGFLISVALYFYRFFLPDGHTNLSEHNNPILSPIGGAWWWLRVIVLWVVLPLIATLQVPKLLLKNRSRRQRAKREREFQDHQLGILKLTSFNDDRR